MMRIAEYLLAATGLALLAIAAYSLAYREVAAGQLLQSASHRDGNPAGAVQPAGRPEPDGLQAPPEDTPGRGPDFSTWSPLRVRMFERMQATLPPVEAVLHVPSIGLEVAIVEGTSDAELNVAAGRTASSAGYGEDGNVSIAAHRDSFFRKLGDIEVGDRLLIQRGEERWVYRTSATFVVDPEDVFVLEHTSRPTLTLVTCYPFYFVGHAPQRYVVQGVLLSGSVDSTT